MLCLRACFSFSEETHIRLLTLFKRKHFYLEMLVCNNIRGYTEKINLRKLFVSHIFNDVFMASCVVTALLDYLRKFLVYKGHIRKPYS